MSQITIRSNVSVLKGALSYISNQQFRATMAGEKGPSPGSFVATAAGVDVDLTNLTNPGIAVLKNIDDEFGAVYGVLDGSDFFPLGDLLPGEQYVIRLSQFLGQTLGSGTGTGGPAVAFHIRGIGGDANVSVEAFET